MVKAVGKWSVYPRLKPNFWQNSFCPIHLIRRRIRKNSLISSFFTKNCSNWKLGAEVDQVRLNRHFIHISTKAIVKHRTNNWVFLIFNWKIHLIWLINWQKIENQNRLCDIWTHNLIMSQRSQPLHYRDNGEWET